MPMIVITIAILIGVSTPQYKEYAKHSNGNAAYTVVYVAPCKDRAARFQAMRLPRPGLSCSSKSRWMTKTTARFVMNNL